RYKWFVLVFYQHVDLALCDSFFRPLANNSTAGLQAFDVMTGNTDIHIFYSQVWMRSKAIVQCRLDGFDRFVDVKHLAVLYSVGIGFSKTKDFELAEFVLTTGDHSDLGC